MTIIMSIIGVFVFFISFPITGFKTAFGRLLKFAAAGVAIDLCLLMITLLILIAL